MREKCWIWALLLIVAILFAKIKVRCQMLKGIHVYRFARKSSGDTLMSLQICRSNNGDKSLDPCIGTVVARPSACRNCWCEPFCRASVKPSFSRIATTSLGFSTGKLPPTSQRPLAGSQRILILIWEDHCLPAQAQPLPSGFPEALQEFRPECGLRVGLGHTPHNSRSLCRAQLLPCRHALSYAYYTPVVAGER